MSAKPKYSFPALSALCLSLVLFAGASHAQKTWVVGQSAPLSGGNAAFGRDIRDGAAAYFKAVNAKGGVSGLPVELVTLDDKNDRKQAGANTQKLLEANNVVALFGFASATLSLDAMPQAEKAGVLFFAPFSGANPVRKPSPVVFTLRASYGDELEKMLAFWTGLGAKNVAVVHYNDEVGTQNLAVVTDYLAKQGKKPVAFPLQRNAKVGEAQVASSSRSNQTSSSTPCCRGLRRKSASRSWRRASSFRLPACPSLVRSNTSRPQPKPAPVCRSRRSCQTPARRCRW